MPNDIAIVTPCMIPACGSQASIRITVLDGTNRILGIGQDSFLCSYHFNIMVLDMYDILSSMLVGTSDGD
jgi:hypothetical protein